MSGRIIFGCDHAGSELCKKLLDEVTRAGFHTVFLGTDGSSPVDYPLKAMEVAQSVARDPQAMGVLVCGTGVGMSIAANKVKGIRAAVVSDTFSARMSRAHNNANILCLGARVLGTGLASDILEAFLSTQFEAGRHSVRLELITRLESAVDLFPVGESEGTGGETASGPCSGSGARGDAGGESKVSASLRGPSCCCSRGSGSGSGD